MEGDRRADGLRADGQEAGRRADGSLAVDWRLAAWCQGRLAGWRWAASRQVAWLQGRRALSPLHPGELGVDRRWAERGACSATGTLPAGTSRASRAAVRHRRRCCFESCRDRRSVESRRSESKDADPFRDVSTEVVRSTEVARSKDGSGSRDVLTAVRPKDGSAWKVACQLRGD